MSILKNKRAFYRRHKNTPKDSDAFFTLNNNNLFSKQ